MINKIALSNNYYSLLIRTPSSLFLKFILRKLEIDKQEPATMHKYFSSFVPNPHCYYQLINVNFENRLCLHFEKLILKQKYTHCVMFYLAGSMKICFVTVKFQNTIFICVLVGYIE